MQERFSGLGATTICEEAINVAKNNRRKAFGKRFRKPEAVMRTILGSDLMSKRHRFKEVEVDMMNTKKSDAVTKAAFMPDIKQASMAFSEIVTSSSTAPYWSPCAQGLSAPAADLKVMQETAPSFAAASTCWLGALFNIKHRFAFQTRSEVASSSARWWLPLDHCDHSAILAWPCTMVRCSQNGDCYFEPDLSVREPQLLVITSLAGIRAHAIQWRSPACQFRAYQVHFRGASLGVRPFALGGPATVLEVAARAGFWRLGKAFLDDLADLLKLQKAATVFQTLVSMTSEILKCSDEEALGYCAARLSATDMDAFHAATLAEADDGIQVLDSRDHDEVRSTVRDATSATEARRQFSKEYQAKRTTIRAEKAAKQSAGSRKRKPQGGASSASASARPALPSVIPQAEAKRYIPPGSSIWRSLTRSAWCGHMPPRARCSEPWQRHGSDAAALHAIVVRMWRQHMEIEGLSPEETPFVLPSVAGREPGSASGVASSSSHP